MEIIRIEELTPEFENAVYPLIEKIFHKEQNIPKDLIPLAYRKQRWWCIEENNKILGVVAIWKKGSQWHWGRLAVHQDHRGLGLGKKLIKKSLDDLFQMGIDNVKIDARALTVKMILQKGGEITGEKDDFFGMSITPMKINKKSYSQNGR